MLLCLLKHACAVLIWQKLHVVPLRSIPTRKPLGRRSDVDSNHFFYQDHLEKDMLTKYPCAVVELVDEAMGINTEIMTVD